jgi:hypothetical protein
VLVLDSIFLLVLPSSAQPRGGALHGNEEMDRLEEQAKEFEGFVGYLIGGNSLAGDSIPLNPLHVFHPGSVFMK